MSQAAPAKKSAYAERNNSHTAAPLEEDSDPEFNSGALVPEPKAKKGRKKKGESNSPKAYTGSKRKRRSEFFDTIIPKPKSKSSSRSDVNTDCLNPLSKWFGQDLELHSATEGEEDAEMLKTDANDGGDEDEEEGEDDGDDLMISKTFALFDGTETTKKQPKTQHDSATESDTDDNDPPPPLIPHKQQVPNNLHRERTQNLAADDSVTESDSDHPPPPKQPIRILSSTASSDSATESESESERLANPRLEPRPGFKLGPKQKYLGGLVLDAKERILVPAAINTYLRDYQRDGVWFFWNQYQKGLGGLLGDDMGLGKTIQVISFLSAIMRKHGDVRDRDRRRNHVSELQDDRAYRKKRLLPPANATWPTCLIIAPSTVVGNWEREFETWSYFEVGIYNGLKETRKEVLKDFKLGRLDIVVTSFELALRDIGLLEHLAWSLVIVDEVHRVKNTNSGTTKALHQFQSPLRFGLTGTAIQNNYAELWTILDWTNPKKLGTLTEWKGFVVHPLTIGQSVKATEEQRVKGIDVALILRDKVLPNFFKRRTKDIIKLQLPKKQDHVVFCPLTDAQITVYRRILDMDAVQNLLHKDDPCPCGSEALRKQCCHPYEPSDMLSFMSVLIKISNHLLLILPSASDTPEQRERHKLLCASAFPNNTTPKYAQMELSSQYCGKWRILEQLLDDWRQDRTNKVLIFTKSIKLLDMLAFHVKNKGYGYLQLDGSVPMPARMPMIDEFHENPNIYIFLISTLAGGTGLNLTGANKVVIFDPNWNPAHDLQAMDRAYRFGQTRDVDVFRLLGAGSVEELIYARQLYKQQQMAIGYDASIQTRYFEGVQNDTSRQGELFGIKNIFKLQEDTLATKHAIEKANIMELDWAMANMESKGPKSKGKGKSDELVQMDIKGDADLRGLGTFLFDDVDAATSRTVQQDDIQKALSAIGAYTHLNEAQLVPTGVEEARYAKASKKRRKSGPKNAGEGLGQSKSPEAVWPPLRKKHRPPPSPRTKLSNRQGALIELGMIHSPAHLAQFAQEFNRKSKEEQIEILRQLDDHAAQNL